MIAVRKKWCRRLAITVIIVFSYFGSAIAFRAWRMNPKNEYYGYYLPGASPTISYTKEQSQRIDEAMLRGPTTLERFYEPAEIIFIYIGL